MNALSLIPHPYDPDWTGLNDGVYNDGPGGGGYGNAGGSLANPADPAVAAPVPPVPAGYRNPCSAYSIPIVFQVPAVNPTPIVAQQLLVANPRRNLILLQNASFATGTDVAPTLWFSFGRPAVPGQCQGLAPATQANGIGEGVVLDVVVPRDALYIAFGPANNAGGTVQVLGSVTEGVNTDDGQSYIPQTPDTGFRNGM